jgi:hypothetical protein
MDNHDALIWDDFDLNESPDEVPKTVVSDDLSKVETRFNIADFDNVEIEIPDVVAPTTTTTTSALSAKEKEMINAMQAADKSDDMSMKDLEAMMEDRRALALRLQTDPEFEKQYIRAEKEYSDKMKGVITPGDDTCDETYKKVQEIVNKIHNKSSSAATASATSSGGTGSGRGCDDSIDPHGLSRFGKISDEIPTDESIVDMVLGDRAGKNQPIIYIKNVNKLVIKIVKK